MGEEHGAAVSGGSNKGMGMRVAAWSALLVPRSKALCLLFVHIQNWGATSPLSSEELRCPAGPISMQASLSVCKGLPFKVCVPFGAHLCFLGPCVADGTAAFM